MNPESPDSEEGGRGGGGGNMAEPGAGAFFRPMVSFLILSGGRAGSGPEPMISSSIVFGLTSILIITFTKNSEILFRY